MPTANHTSVKTIRYQPTRMLSRIPPVLFPTRNVAVWCLESDGVPLQRLSWPSREESANYRLLYQHTISYANISDISVRNIFCMFLQGAGGLDGCRSPARAIPDCTTLLEVYRCCRGWRITAAVPMVRFKCKVRCLAVGYEVYLPTKLIMQALKSRHIYYE